MATMSGAVSAAAPVRKCTSCGSGLDKHTVVAGIVLCPSTVRKIRRMRRSYALQVFLCVAVTLALPYLVGHLHADDSVRSKTAAMQPVWDWVLRTIPGPASHFLFGSVLACATFIISALYFSYKDLMRHDTKIQKDWWPSTNDMLVAGVPQVFLYIVLNWATWVLVDERIELPAEAPSLWEFARDFTIMLIVGDFYIYFEHRTMHTFTFLRDNIHSVHHSYKKVFAWAGGWVHPIEDLIAVLTQVACPMWFLHPHPLTFWVFVCFWTLCLVDEHSGHDVWWSPYAFLPFSAGGGGAPHDIHHYKPFTNFGFVFNIWDIIFDTMEDVTEWFPGKTDFAPFDGGQNFAPKNGFVPVEGWKAYNSAKTKNE